MKLVSKLAAFAAAGAIGVTGLVAATGTAADAATVTKSYTCTTPVGSFPVPVAFTLPTLPTSLPAGSTVPSLPVSAAMTLPSQLASALSLVTSSLGGTITGSGALGSVPVPANLSVPTTDLASSGDQVLNATGSLSSFKAPTTAGTYAFTLPTTITADLVPGQPSLAATCTLPASQAAVGSVKVTGATAPATKTFVVKAPKTGKLHKAVKIKVTTNQTGKVIAKIKGKKVAKAQVKAGHATLKVKKGLKKGKNKIVVSLGSLHKTVKVKIKK